MPLEFRCLTCRRLYVPGHADIVAGPAVYRLCPDCRPVVVENQRPAEDSGVVA